MDYSSRKAVSARSEWHILIDGKHSSTTQRYNNSVITLHVFLKTDIYRRNSHRMHSALMSWHLFYSVTNREKKQTLTNYFGPAKCLRVAIIWEVFGTILFGFLPFRVLSLSPKTILLIISKWKKQIDSNKKKQNWKINFAMNWCRLFFFLRKKYINSSMNPDSGIFGCFFLVRSTLFIRIRFAYLQRCCFMHFAASSISCW